MPSTLKSPWLACKEGEPVGRGGLDARGCSAMLVSNEACENVTARRSWSDDGGTCISSLSCAWHSVSPIKASVFGNSRNGLTDVKTNTAAKLPPPIISSHELFEALIQLQWAKHIIEAHCPAHDGIPEHRGVIKEEDRKNFVGRPAWLICLLCLSAGDELAKHLHLLLFPGLFEGVICRITSSIKIAKC